LEYHEEKEDWNNESILTELDVERELVAKLHRWSYSGFNTWCEEVELESYCEAWMISMTVAAWQQLVVNRRRQRTKTRRDAAHENGERDQLSPTLNEDERQW